MEMSVQKLFSGAELPVQGVKRAVDRLASLRGSDGIPVKTTDHRLIAVMGEIGDAEVKGAIQKCLAWGYSQSTFNWKEFSSRMMEFCKVSKTHNLVGQPVYESAKTRVLGKLSAQIPGKLRMRPIKDERDLYNRLPKIKASAGFLGCVTGKSKKGDNLGEIFQGYTYKMEHLSEVNYSPVVFAQRTKGGHQVEGDGSPSKNHKCKTKVIQVISAEDVAVEMVTAQPFYEAFCQCDEYAGGKNPQGLTTRFNYLRQNFSNWVSIDYSNYDSTIPSWLIRDAFGILFDLFEEVPEEYQSFIIKGFIKTPFVWDDGEVHFTDHGVPSGSYFTQAIDSICNLIMVEMYMMHRGISYFDNVVMGDDNSIWTRRPLDLKDLAYFIWTRFGVKVSAEKCSHGTSRQDPEFLSRVWTEVGAKRPIAAVVWNAITPERRRKYQKGTRPELLIYALLDVYPLTIVKHFNLMELRRRLPDVTSLFQAIDLFSADLPGSVRYNLEYLDGDFVMRIKPPYKPGRSTNHSTQSTVGTLEEVGVELKSTA